MSKLSGHPSWYEPWPIYFCFVNVVNEHNFGRVLVKVKREKFLFSHSAVSSRFLHL